MKTSRYFSALISSYQAEIDDLSTDSEGKNVLASRLKTKRKQVPQLLMMLASAPEMVAVAFHGAFGFKQRKTMEALVAKEGHFPHWAALKPALTVEPWAESLIDSVLTSADGEHFLATTVGLEFLIKHSSEQAVVVQHEEPVDDQDDEQEREQRDVDDGYLSSDDRVDHEGESNEFDLDKAGADFLADQGFDRKE